MKMIYIIFPLVFLLFWIGSRQALYKLLIRPLKWHRNCLFLYDSIYLSTAVLSVLVRLSIVSENSIVTSSLRVHYIIMGISWLLFTSQILIILIKKFPSKKKNIFIQDRRDFLKKNVALGGFGVIASATTIGAVQAISPNLKKVEIELEDKYKKLSGLKIVQLSDVHIGPTLKKDFFDELVTRTNELKPDLVVITGDLVDGRVENLEHELTGLAEFKSTLGTYYITGNHEYYWEGEKWIDFVRSKGVHVFENTNKILNYNGQDFCLGGVYDLKATTFVKSHICSPQEAFKSSPSDLYKILLAHQPNSCKLAEGLDINLQLSGHTHGGQGFPWNLIIGLVQPYLKGLYNHKGMDLYVNAGTGFWGPPYRLGIPGEITHLTLI